MIKHIVMWKLKSEAMGGSRQENAAKIKQKLEGLAHRIKEIRNIEVGLNSSSDEAAYDVVLVSEFLTWADLRKYQEHPLHKEVASYIANVREQRVVVDYDK
jgi:hypothetical protein